jgi:hypothetical protein
MIDCPCRSKRVLVQRAEEQTVLLDVDSGTYFALDNVGARIWKLCDGERGVDDIVATICGEYDAPYETIRADVLGLLDELRAEQLLAAP